MNPLNNQNNFQHFSQNLSKTTTAKSFNFIDLFSGLGGFRIALESLGGNCVFSSEIDSAAAKTYLKNFGEKPAGDITKILSDQIPDHDILCAGFPCQPFSIGGKRLGFNDTRGTLFFEVARILKDKKPKAFFLENVAGLKSHDQGNTLATIEKTLKELGYCIAWKVINAKDIGYPQNRNRWYCVGIKTEHILDETIFDLVTSTLNFNFPQIKPLLYTIENLLETNSTTDYQISTIATHNIENYLPNFIKSSRHNENFVIIANEIRKSRCNFKADGISPCLTAKMGTGGNNVPVLVSQNRKLTERECLRIMGFPDSYYIQPNYSQSYKQIGNSVIVPVIRDIASELIKLL